MVSVTISGGGWFQLPAIVGKKYVGQNKSNSNLLVFEGATEPDQGDKCFVITPFQTFRIDPQAAIWVKNDTRAIVTIIEVA